MSTMTISDLRIRRAHIWDQAKAFLDERRDADLARATNQPLTSMPGITIHDDDNTKPKAPRATASYSRAFWDAMRLNTSPMEVRNALSEGVDTEGGDRL